MTEESAVRVCVRVRPLIAREESAASENEEPVHFWKADQKSIHQIDDGNSTKSFSFDRVFTADETTSQLYHTIAKPLVVSTVEGYNGTIFAYGQTSSGKTFTMMGSDRTPGVIPLAVEDVFQTIKNFPNKEFLLRVSYMEIYNETVTDLLVDSWKRKPLEVREQINKTIYVADLTEELVTSPSQVLAWIRKGEKNRHYGKTKMNQRSSRSHTIFRMILESREMGDSTSSESGDGAIIVSHLNLVDLAGSERASQTGAEGARFKEGCNINRSLFILGQVIKKLTDENQKGFTNYRDSKLTRILQNSLGGNAKTVIICTITPAALDETLSTLQFASTAKKMKNDPHVTEVSDDGALLKRYRNEIVDLKRRLHEVSSVTQTTVTEKEVLSQLLQEKDQLQREQEDRIRNLTKLLVTGSNLVPIHKVPKRRVTWGGKMLKLGHASACVGGSSDLSFAESFTRKRKVDFCLTELGEDDEDFDSNWGIPDEPSDEMEISQSSVTIRSFGESPRDFVSPDRMQELSGKVSSLEMQLERESQQKEEAVSKVEALDGRVAELQLQLQTEAQQKGETLEKMQAAEQQAAELQLQLQAEAQQRLEAMDRVDVLESRVRDLERQLGEGSNSDPDANEQMRREFAETIQLCETLASEKDMLVTERDYLRQELGMFIEQTDSLEKEKAVLSQQLREKMELEEFRFLEAECTREQEKELQSEISSLKMAVESSELQCLELQNKLETLSEQLKEKTEFAEELQNLSGKDLVEEVAKLRRSLNDAEGLSKDTMKEWAVLRSQNIALEETNVALTASQEKMEAEMKSLRSQLETEKARYKKMQSDLQKELNVAFDENTKLTSLLDGRVPKNLIDSVELERTVASLNKELTESREAEKTLTAHLDELASFQNLPDKVDGLMKQLEDGEQQRAALEGKLSEMQQLLKDLQEKLADSEVSRTTEEEISRELQEQVSQLNEELQCVRAEKAALLCEQSAGVQRSAEETEKLLSTLTSLSAQRDQLELKLLEHVDMVAEKQVVLQSLQHELQEQKEKNSNLMKASEQKESELGEHTLRLSQELQAVREEKEALLTTAAQRSSEEVENLLATVASLTAERDQLKLDLQENVEMMIENQEELRTALEKNREQKKQIKELETAQLSKVDGPPSDMNTQLLELQTHMKTLTEEFENVRAERDVLLLEKEANAQTSTEEMEQLQGRVTSISEERDQLQEILEALRQEKQQLRAEMEDRMDTLQAEVGTLTLKLQTIEAERDHLLSEKEAQTSTEEMEQLQSRVTSISEERDQLQEILEALRQEKQQLRAEMEDRMEMFVQVQSELNQPETLTSELQAYNERERQLQREVEQLQAALQAVTAQKNQVEGDLQSSKEMAAETQSLLHSLQEQLKEQNQRNAHLERVGQEGRAQLEQQVEETNCLVQRLQEELQKQSEQVKLYEQEQLDFVQKMKTLTEEFENVRAERDVLLLEKEANAQTSTEEMEQLQSRVTSISEERDQLQEILEALRQEKQQLRAETEDRMDNLQAEVGTLTLKLQTIEAERDHLLSEKEAQTSTEEMEQLQGRVTSISEEMEQLQGRVTSLSEERDQLQEILEALRQEKQQLRAELEDRMDTLQAETAQLNMSLQAEGDQKRQLENDLLQSMDTVRTLAEKLERAEAEINGLLAEKQLNAQTSTEEMEQLQGRVTSISEERDQLQEILEALRQEKQQLRAETEDRMDTLQAEVGTLTLKLQTIEAERDHLLSEKEAQTSTEEVEQLQSRVTSISEERDQLQEILEALREEKQQLRAELEDRVETISAIQEKLSQQEQLQSERGEQEAKLQQDVLQLEQQLQMYKEKQDQAESEAGVSQQLLSEANATISALREQLSSLEQSTRGVQESVSSRLQESTDQLEESFKRFQLFIDSISGYKLVTQQALREQHSLKCTSPPKATKDTYDAIFQLGQATDDTLRKIQVQLCVQAQAYKNMFEELVRKDLAVFEEKRLHDVMLCKAQAPSYSVKDEDFHALWEHRLPELLDRRQLYLQKMSSILGTFKHRMTSYLLELKAEIPERADFTTQLQALIANQPVSFSGLDSILSPELDRRTAGTQRKKLLLQSIIDETTGPFEELKQMEAQAEAQLREVKSKNFTLLEALGGVPLKSTISLLKDNQQLVFQLQQAEEQIKALRVHTEQLEEAQVKANKRVSNHKEATQLLQTELQDSRALVEKQENTIQTLKSKLRESEKKTSPSAAELEKLQTKLMQMEMKLSSASSEHQQEIQKMTTLLREKEELLRKLKETLRKSQQEGEESFLQGKDLHARLTNPKGSVISSSVLLEKSKLEEEVRWLQGKLAEQESLVSSQQAEISKWKNRAIKLKVRSKAEVDKPPSPSTPTKRAPPVTLDSSSLLNSPKKFWMTPKKFLDSPRKVLESPNKFLDAPQVLNSPKSRFFDMGGSAEMLSRSCPKQFFDNSSLGTVPDAAVDVGRKDEWWPASPKQEEMCKTQ